MNKIEDREQELHRAADDFISRQGLEVKRSMVVVGDTKGHRIVHG